MNTAVFDGIAYRVRDGRPEQRPVGEARYTPMRPRDLLALPIDSEAWLWLRAQGVRRPSPSGDSGRTQPRDERTNKRVELNLHPVQIDDLRARARSAKTTISDYVAKELKLKAPT